MHIVRAAVGALLLSAAIALVVWSTGLGAYVPASVAAAIVAAGLVGGAGWALWGNRRSRVGVSAGLAALGLSVVLYAALGQPYSQGRLRLEMGRLDTPAGFIVDSDESGGNHLCFDTCTERTRTWFVPAGSVTEARDAFARFLRDNGFSVGTGDVAAFSTVRRGSLTGGASILTPQEAGGSALVVPPGHFLGRLTLYAK